MHDMTGMKFGKWTVVRSLGIERFPSGNGHEKLLCRCDCGREIAVNKYNLTAGKSTQCKTCSVSDNIDGQKFGKLTAIRRAPKDPRYPRKSFYLFRCDCGKEKVIRTCAVVGGNTNTCGCGRVGTIPKIESLYNQLFGHYMRSAKLRGFPFELTMAQFMSFLDKPCYYCGEVGSNETHTGRDYQGRRSERLFLKYNGIDRLDSSKGYVRGNVVPCCGPCNWAKNDASEAEYIDRCRRIAQRHPA